MTVSPLKAGDPLPEKVVGQPRPCRLRGATSAVVFVLLTAGCSSMKPGGLAYQPTVLSVQTVLSKATKHSSEIYSTMGFKGGKTTPEGPLVLPDPHGIKHSFYVEHNWAVYNLDDKTLGEGFHRLRARMPDKGWKVAFYGTVHDAAHTPTLDIENLADHFTVRIQWWHTSNAGGAELNVQLDSPVHLKPKGQ